VSVKPTKHTYAEAGVSIESADHVKKFIAKLARTTYTPNVLSGVGLFGGLYEFKGYNKPVLVSSTDGVGTKLKLAAALNRYDSIGFDIVNHCINDILTCGARPLFFLDYIAMGHLVPEQVEAIVSGLAQSCSDAGCALIGGETAEMPGVYSGKDFDLVGFIVGVVERDKIIDTKKISPGDAILGLPSSGLHTNGFSLVRKIFGVSKVELKRHYPELGRTLGEALVEPHHCYLTEIEPLLPLIKGLAHITGGGLPGNVPRILPPGMSVVFDSFAWTVPPLFRIIQKRGNIEMAEMYKVFNMGIGMAVICAAENVDKLTSALPQAKIIGRVVQQTGKDKVTIK
jgi:phosphoribosylformylglycinamidine cyclo-ligase